MIPLETELVYIIGVMGTSVIRVFYHSYVSRRKKQSITPIKYWLLTLIIWVSMGIYGYLIGSAAMILSFAGGIIYSLYHINLEIKRIPVKK